MASSLAVFPRSRRIGSTWREQSRTGWIDWRNIAIALIDLRSVALLCVGGLLLEVGLFLKHRLWGGYPPDARLDVGLVLALLVNLYLLRGRRTVSR